MNIELITINKKDFYSIKQKITYKELLNITTNFINITSIDLIKVEDNIFKVDIKTTFNNFLIIFEAVEDVIYYLNDLKIICNLNLKIGGKNQ